MTAEPPEEAVEAVARALNAVRRRGTRETDPTPEQRRDASAALVATAEVLRGLARDWAPPPGMGDAASTSAVMDAAGWLDGTL